MEASVRRMWPYAKAVFTAAILFFIARIFVRDCLNKPELWQRPLHLGWAVLSGVLYLLGLGFSAFYWYRLLVALEQQPAFLATLRAHYIGQVGKYVPGKAWALLLRSNLISSPTTRVSMGLVTSFYEVFITMSCGALLAAVLLSLQDTDFSRPTDWHIFQRMWQISQGGEAEAAPVDPHALAVLACLLFLAIGIPSLPLIFHRVVQRLTRILRQTDTSPVPTPGVRLMVEGFALTPGCWLMMGASVWAALQVFGAAPNWNAQSLCRYTAFLALAYVAGFVTFLPSGIGVREAILVLVLVPDISQRLSLGTADARALAWLTVWLLRLVWTAAEAVTAGILYCLPWFFARGSCH